MDGKEVEFTSDATTGMPTATVNFKDLPCFLGEKTILMWKVDGLDSLQHLVRQHRVYLIDLRIRRQAVSRRSRLPARFVRRFLDDIDGYRFDHDERYRV